MDELRHGTSGAYAKGCRCDVCKTFKRQQSQAYYERNRDRIKARTSEYAKENRDAVRARQKQYREANADAIKEHKRRVYAANPERDKQRAREWEAANPQRRATTAKAYREANVDKIRKQKLADYHALMEKDPERVRARRRAYAKTDKGIVYNRMARHKRRGASPDALAREWAAIVLKDPCAYCGEPAVELDHIQPLSAQGSGTWDNLTGACRGCNARKNDQPLLSFVAA